MVFPLSSGLSSSHLNFFRLNMGIFDTVEATGDTDQVISPATIMVNGVHLHKDVWANYSRSLDVMETKVQAQDSKSTVSENWEYFVIAIVILLVVGIVGLLGKTLWERQSDNMIRQHAMTQYELRQQGSVLMRNECQKLGDLQLGNMQAPVYPGHQLSMLGAPSVPERNAMEGPVIGAFDTKTRVHGWTS